MKIIAISDTHGKHWDLKVPNGDLFLFAGDANISDYLSIKDFNDWLGLVPCKRKIVIGGNHDSFLENNGKIISQKLLDNCIYLENDFIEVDGFKIFGSPFSPFFNNWAFMRYDNMLKEIWDSIPLETEIVLTHSMPYGILDGVLPRMQSVGSLTLRDAIKRVRPYIQIGGHLHESFGQYTDGKTDYYNVSVLDEQYQVANPVTVIEV